MKRRGKYPGVFRLWYRGRDGKRRQTTTFFIKYYVKGKPIRERTGLTDAAQAASLRRRRLTEIEEHRYVGPRAEKTTIADLEELVKDEYSAIGRRTKDDLKRRFKNTRKYFEGVRCVDIGLAELNAYVRARRDIGAAPGTIKVELDILHHGWVLGVKTKRLHAVPEFPKIEVDNARRVFVDRPLLDSLLEHMPLYLRPVFLVALLTGWRREAILSLQRSAVDLQGRWLRLPALRSKNKEPVTVALIPALYEIFNGQDNLARAIELRTGRLVPWCFFYTEDTAHYKAGARIVSFEHAWNATRKAAGLLGHVRFHDIRRGAIRTLRRAGNSEHEVMEWVGLKTRHVFDAYDIIDEDRRREIGGRLQAFYEAQRGEKPSLSGFTKKS
jgi:integrase